MTTTVLQDGKTMAYVAPTGGITSGQLVLLTNGVGVAYDAIAGGATGTLLMCGVFTVTKTAHAAGGFSQGDTVYATTAGLITATATATQRVGMAWAASTTAALSVPVSLNFGAIS